MLPPPIPKINLPANIIINLVSLVVDSKDAPYAQIDCPTKQKLRNKNTLEPAIFIDEKFSKKGRCHCPTVDRIEQVVQRGAFVRLKAVNNCVGYLRLQHTWHIETVI